MISSYDGFTCLFTIQGPASAGKGCGQDADSRSRDTTIPQRGLKFLFPQGQDVSEIYGLYRSVTQHYCAVSPTVEREETGA